MTPVITSWQQGAWVALDILLVALLIYQVLIMIRGTRAVPMLVGLVVVAVTFYLARVGELTTLNWVVSHVLPYLVFALIVVFQSEIRHVLADLGRRLTFFSGSSAALMPRVWPTCWPKTTFCLTTASTAMRSRASMFCPRARGSPDFCNCWPRIAWPGYSKRFPPNTTC